MKKQMMALAAVGAIALLSACGTDTTTDSGSATDETPAGATNLQVCAKYFDGGEQSVAQRVTDELEFDMAALTDDQSNAMRSTNIQLEAILRLAGPEDTNLVISKIKTPFQMADDIADETGTEIDTTGVAEAVADLQTICDNAGYTAS
ncbi:hypothetical protein ACFRCR_02520 [Oerskovia sp. NPDC056781]|uniref:hypothetical protein n=1 Tax=Oerskovia sp. NPDC056781 TaxID=3345942 RepID=UPI00366B2AFC